jgi:opacity protein-like surface antigen
MTPIRRTIMRNQSIILGALILIILSLHAPAFAFNNWYAGIQLGPEFLTNDTDYNLDSAFALGIYGGYRINRQISLEGSLTTAGHDGVGNSELNVTSVLFGPRLSAPVNRNMNVYADAGLGVHFLDYQYGHYDHSETESGLYLGAGVEFPFQNNIKFGMDLKYNALFDNHPVNSDVVTVLLRLGF